MDELSKLKKMWEDSFDREDEALDEARILEIIRKRSSNPVDKLKKSLYLEIGTAITVIPLLIWVMFRLPEPYFIINTAALLSLFTGVLMYYYYNLRRVSAYWKLSQNNLRESIEGTLLVFRFFRKTYFYLNILLFPLGIYFGYIIGFGLGSGGGRVTSMLMIETLPLWANASIWILAGIGAFSIFLLILTFYVRKLYDVHIAKLADIFTELTENDNQIK
jgi:hypothetical protein